VGSLVSVDFFVVPTAQQIVNAFPDDSAPSYLLHDHDQVYGGLPTRRGYADP
jgi:hypothetical protein